MADVEHEGQLYRIPRALTGALQSSADHARRAQALADRGRSLDEHARRAAQTLRAAEEHLADRAQLQVLDHQLEVFAGLDWRLLADEAPEKAQALWARFQGARAVRDRFAASLTNQIELSRARAEREHAQRMAEADAALSHEIDGWSPEAAEKLVEYAGAFGITPDELRQVADARLWKLLHRAYASENGESRGGAAQARPGRPAVVGNSPRDDIPTREWMRRRNAQASGA